MRWAIILVCLMCSAGLRAEPVSADEAKARLEAKERDRAAATAATERERAAAEKLEKSKQPSDKDLQIDALREALTREQERSHNLQLKIEALEYVAKEREREMARLKATPPEVKKKAEDDAQKAVAGASRMKIDSTKPNDTMRLGKNVSVSNMSFKQDGRVVECLGELRNDNSKLASYVTLKVALYDRNGKLVGNGLGMIQNVPAADSKAFTINMFDQELPAEGEFRITLDSVDLEKNVARRRDE